MTLPPQTGAARRCSMPDVVFELQQWVASGLAVGVHPVEPSAGKPGRRARVGMMTSVHTAIETTLPM